MALHDLPVDIILEIVNFLELSNAIALLITCSTLYRLSTERSFWISVLETTRKISPIGCPRHAQLSQLTLDTLKCEAFSWLKLQKNLSLPFPQLVHPPTRNPLPERAQIIFAIQGTDILLIATISRRGKVFCWDARLGAAFPFPAIETGGAVTQVSCPSERSGVCVLSIIALPLGALQIPCRYIITIEHEAGKAVSFTSESSEVSIPPQSHFEGLFVTEDIVGMMIAVDNEKECSLTVSGVTNGSHIPTSTSILDMHRLISPFALIVTFSYNDHLYILLEDGSSVQVQHISRKSLQSGHIQESGLFHCDIQPSDTDFDAFCFMIPSTQFYGISAVFVRMEWRDDNVEPDEIRVTSFTFLPNSLSYASDDGVSSPLIFDSPCVTHCVSGALVAMGLVWLDHSGFHVAAVIQPDQRLEPPNLILVQYHPESHSTSSHTLTIPDDMDAKNLCSVCFDDAAGAVHLVDTEGILTSLRYV
ncbi:F-box domain-containing protein [Favolaschia claudopus]|uniref:F-box domain-containing protein n=1 Tax=Favolaschia claudopus TaxID=2862362 RepID=A0AAW0E1T2_9AGAR